MNEMKSNPLLRYIVRPILGKGLWQDRVSFLFFAIALLILVYLVVSMLTSPFYFQKLGTMQADQNLMGLRDLPELQSVDVYNRVVEAHPLFGTLKEEVAAVSKSPCDDFSQIYSLSGIVQGGQNEAIFMNKRTRQTLFAAPGDELENVTIRAIEDHSVRIACAGDEREIMIEET